MKLSRNIRPGGMLPLILLATLAPALAGSPPTVAPPAPAKGVFLVAAAGVADPRFQETVILLIQHDEAGSAGLIVNRPTRISLAHALPQVEELAGRTDPVYFGGPVDLNALLVLVQGPASPGKGEPVFDQVYVTGLPEMLSRLRQGERAEERFRVFMGYAGWAPGQLAAEIARGDWQLRTAEAGAIFDHDPATLWRNLYRDKPPVWVRGTDERPQGEGMRSSLIRSKVQGCWTRDSGLGTCIPTSPDNSSGRRSSSHFKLVARSSPGKPHA